MDIDINTGFLFGSIKMYTYTHQSFPLLYQPPIKISIDAKFYDKKCQALFQYLVYFYCYVYTNIPSLKCYHYHVYIDVRWKTAIFFGARTASAGVHSI